MRRFLILVGLFLVLGTGLAQTEPTYYIVEKVSYKTSEGREGASYPAGMYCQVSKTSLHINSENPLYIYLNYPIRIYQDGEWDVAEYFTTSNEGATSVYLYVGNPNKSYRGYIAVHVYLHDSDLTLIYICRGKTR